MFQARWPARWDWPAPRPWRQTCQPIPRSEKAHRHLRVTRCSNRATTGIARGDDIGDFQIDVLLPVPPAPPLPPPPAKWRSVRAPLRTVPNIEDQAAVVTTGLAKAKVGALGEPPLGRQSIKAPPALSQGPAITAAQAQSRAQSAGQRGQALSEEQQRQVVADRLTANRPQASQSSEPSQPAPSSSVSQTGPRVVRRSQQQHLVAPRPLDASKLNHHAKVGGDLLLSIR